jgi:signal peptidase I
MEPTTAPAPTSSRPSRLRGFIENLLYIGVAVGLALLVQQFLIRPFIVNGTSMDPTLETGDYLLIDRLSYRFAAPDRGDVIVFQSPPEPEKYFVKRIIGLPGETVVLEGSTVTIINEENPNGFVLTEPFITHKKNDSMRVTVPDNHYFVMGDNRSGSYDSRGWGTLPKENIGGRALLRLLPIQSLDYLPGKVTYE